jgi:hypothetical protein
VDPDERSLARCLRTEDPGCQSREAVSDRRGRERRWREGGTMTGGVSATTSGISWGNDGRTLLTVTISSDGRRRALMAMGLPALSALTKEGNDNRHLFEHGENR